MAKKPTKKPAPKKAAKTPAKARPVFTLKEQRFIDLYVICVNGAKAAREAGFPENSARQAAYELLTKPYIRAEVDKRLQMQQLGRDETIKRIADIAKSSINDYMVVKQREVTPEIRIGLSQVIASTLAKIEDVEKYKSRATLTKQQLESLDDEIMYLHNSMVELEIELERNPKASRLVKGEPYMEEYMELDTVRLARDQELGRVKMFKNGRDGVQVELYSAQEALRDIGRVHGIFEKDNRVVNLNTEPLTKEEVIEISKALDDEY